MNVTFVLAQEWRCSSSMTFSTLSLRCFHVVFRGRRSAAEKCRFSRTVRVPRIVSSYPKLIYKTIKCIIVFSVNSEFKNVCATQI